MGFLLGVGVGWVGWESSVFLVGLCVVRLGGIVCWFGLVVICGGVRLVWVGRLLWDVGVGLGLIFGLVVDLMKFRMFFWFGGCWLVSFFFCLVFCLVLVVVFVVVIVVWCMLVLMNLGNDEIVKEEVFFIVVV